MKRGSMAALVAASWQLAVAVNCLASEITAVTGITEPVFDLTLSASAPGIVTAVRYKEGDFVKQGDVIIELDKRLEELEVERRKVVLQTRRIDYESTAKLFQTTKGTSKEEVQKKESDYKLAQVEHDMAIEQLRRRVVIAPISGIVMEFPVDVGESCQAYQPVARLVDTRRCYFVANIEPQAAATLHTNKEVRLEIETGAAPEPVTGAVTFLSPVADPASSLIGVKAIFENPAGKVRAGLAGRLHLK